jgi:hypothetical protein
MELEYKYTRLSIFRNSGIRMSRIYNFEKITKTETAISILIYLMAIMLFALP